MAPARRKPESEERIPIHGNSVTKKKDAAARIKEAREKYSQMSRAQIVRKESTRPITPAVARKRETNARADAHSLGDGGVSTRSMFPRPSITTNYLSRPSIGGNFVAPRPSIAANTTINRSRVATSVRPIDGLSKDFKFEVNEQSKARILRNEPLPMAPGARASSIARRQMPRSSLCPLGINQFLTTNERDKERLERHLNERLGPVTPGKPSICALTDITSVHPNIRIDPLSRVRFKAEVIQEQRESAGDDDITDMTNSNRSGTSSTMASSSSISVTHAFTMQREKTTLNGMEGMLGEGPRSILKRQRKPGMFAPIVKREMDSYREERNEKSEREEIERRKKEEEEKKRMDEEIRLKEENEMKETRLREEKEVEERKRMERERRIDITNTPRARTPAGPSTSATPARSARRTKKEEETTFTSLYACMLRLSDEEWKKAPVEMLRDLRQRVEKWEEEAMKSDDEEESETHVEDSPQLNPLDVTISSALVNRRRSSRIAHNHKHSRSLFKD